MRLAGRRALVTGGGRGIGRAIAQAFAEEGAHVLVVARSAAELAETAALGAGGRIEAEVLDVTDRAQLDGLAARVRRCLGGLDLLVNNAGIWMERDFLAYTREEWDRTLATNLTAVFDVTQALLPLVLESDSGRILNIAAIDGQVGFARLAAQCASKAGVLGLTRALAKEFWNRPLTVNAICPAAVDKAVGYADTPARAPGPELALPWDVARAAVYLASADGVRVNGAALSVHGAGFLAS